MVTELSVPEDQVYVDAEETDDDEEEVVRIQQTEMDFQRIGITQIVFGCTSLISCAASLTSRGPFSIDRSGAGIWCGIMVIIAGSLSISARFYRPSFLILCNMILSVIVGLFGCGLSVTYLIISLQNLFRNEMEFSSLYFFQTSIAVIWTTLTIFNGVIFSRISLTGRDNICQMVCCPRSVPNYHAMTMMYIPPLGNSAATTLSDNAFTNSCLKPGTQLTSLSYCQ